MENNAGIVSTYFIMFGASYESVAAILANMEAESSVNPGIWESLEPFAGGYGLVQWTPYTNYSDWYGEGWEDNGYGELSRIIYEYENGLQWIETSEYPISFKDFMVSRRTPEWLAQAFVKNYERPESPDQDYRSDYATEWYKFVKKVNNPWYIFLSRRKRWWEYGR